MKLKVEEGKQTLHNFTGRKFDLELAMSVSGCITCQASAADSRVYTKPSRKHFLSNCGDIILIRVNHPREKQAPAVMWHANNIVYGIEESAFSFASMP